MYLKEFTVRHIRNRESIKVKKVIMYKSHNYSPTPLYGQTWEWSIEEVWDDWNHVYSDPYEVEIPDDFELGETTGGMIMYFKKGCSAGYEIGSEDPRKESGRPCLFGGSFPEIIVLNVVRRIEE